MYTSSTSARLYTWIELEHILEELAEKMRGRNIDSIRPLKQTDFIATSLLAHIFKCPVDTQNGATFSVTSAGSPSICIFDLLHPSTNIRPLSYEQVEMNENGVFPAFSMPWNK